jgi:hypothetical protein
MQFRKNSSQIRPSSVLCIDQWDIWDIFKRSTKCGDPETHSCWHSSLATKKWTRVSDIKNLFFLKERKKMKVTKF